MTRPEMPTVEVEGLEFLYYAGASIKVKHDDREVWLPESQLDIDPRTLDKGDVFDVEIPEWLALREGLI